MPAEPPPSGFAGLSAPDLRRLGAGELLVFDGALGPERARELAERLTASRDGLAEAGVGRGGERVLDRGVRGDLTRWLERASAGPEAPLFALFDGLERDLRERAWLGVRATEVQLALYPGGGERYAAHRDAFAAGGRRRATAIYYLNAAWRPGDGGELRAHTPAGTLTVEPLLDRLVLYLSERVEHEVLPVHAPRWAVTAWFLGP
jgi:SM-20-related protein